MKNHPHFCITQFPRYSSLSIIPHLRILANWLNWQHYCVKRKKKVNEISERWKRQTDCIPFRRSKTLQNTLLDLMKMRKEWMKIINCIKETVYIFIILHFTYLRTKGISRICLWMFHVTIFIPIRSRIFTSQPKNYIQKFIIFLHFHFHPITVRCCCCCFYSYFK